MTTSDRWYLLECSHYGWGRPNQRSRLLRCAICACLRRVVREAAES